MKALALAAALALPLAAPVLAQDASGFAIMHFNMDEDGTGNLRMVPMGMMTNVDLNPGSTLSDVFGHFNMDADSQMDVSGTGSGVTIIMRDPAVAADIFRALAAESRENE